MLDTVYLRLVEMSIQASIMILVVLAARLLLRRAPKGFSYALWLLVLLRLLCPGLLEFPLSLMPTLTEQLSSHSLSGRGISLPEMGMAAIQAVGDALNGGEGVQIHTSQVDALGNRMTVLASWWEILLLVGKYVWLCGVVVLMASCLIRYGKLRRSMKEAARLEDNIYISDRLDTPLVMGLLIPQIYLPSLLSEQERRHILAHERCHIRRLDPAVKLMFYIAVMLHWMNPLVWLAFRLFSRDMEMLCDEAAMETLGREERASYCETLLKLSDSSRGPGMAIPAFGEGDTKARVKNLARGKRAGKWIAVPATLLVAVIAVLLATDPINAEHVGARNVTVHQTTDTELVVSIPYSYAYGGYTVQLVTPEDGEYGADALLPYEGDLGPYRVMISFGDLDMYAELARRFPHGEVVELTQNPVRVLAKRVNPSDRGFVLYLGFEEPVTLGSASSGKLNQFWGTVRIPILLYEESAE